MRGNLARLVRARVARWHTRRGTAHIQKAERVLFNGEPLVDVEMVAGLLALLLVIICALT